jgi:hypothetical protein
MIIQIRNSSCCVLDIVLEAGSQCWTKPDTWAWNWQMDANKRITQIWSYNFKKSEHINMKFKIRRFDLFRIQGINICFIFSVKLYDLKRRMRIKTGKERRRKRKCSNQRRSTWVSVEREDGSSAKLRPEK